MLVLQAKVLALLPLAPLLAAVAELRVQRAGEAKVVQRNLMKAGAVASAVILGGTFAFAPAFITLWLGHGYEDAGVVARIFTVAVSLNVFTAPIAYQAFAEGLHRVAAVGAVINIVVNGLVSLVLTIRIGLYGAVIGSVTANLIATGLFLFLVHRRLRAWLWPPILAPLVGVVMAGVVLLAGLDELESWLQLILATTGFVVIVGAAGCHVERLSLRAAVAALGARSS
jgi:O-antigen/teichoic acid export membrane protein